MTLDQAMRLKDATARVKNRSAWINSAITAKIEAWEAWDINDVSTGQLMNAFHARVCGCQEALICPNYRILSDMRHNSTKTSKW